MPNAPDIIDEVSMGLCEAKASLAVAENIDPVFRRMRCRAVMSDLLALRGKLERAAAAIENQLFEQISDLR